MLLDRSTAFSRPTGRLRLPGHPSVGGRTNAAILAALAALLLPTLPLEGQTVRGRLLEIGTDRPVLLGRVALVDTTFTPVEQTLTDHEGRFELTAPGPGAYWVVADRIGYQPSIDGILELGEGGFIEVAYRIRPRPIELEGITATAERERIERRLDLAGFYNRRNAGFGDFIGPEELERRPPVDSRDLLRGIPSVRVSDGFAGQVLTCNGRFPRIFVDGIQVGFLPLHASGTPNAVLEDFAPVEDIAAVEVYRRPSALPLQYGNTMQAAGGATGGTGSSGDDLPSPPGSPRCTVLIWTRGG